MKTRMDGRQEITVGWAVDGAVEDRRTGDIVQVTRSFARRINVASIGDEVCGVSCQGNRLAAIILPRLV